MFYFAFSRNACQLPKSDTKLCFLARGGDYFFRIIPECKSDSEIRNKIVFQGVSQSHSSFRHHLFNTCFILHFPGMQVSSRNPKRNCVSLQEAVTFSSAFYRNACRLLKTETKLCFKVSVRVTNYFVTTYSKPVSFRIFPECMSAPEIRYKNVFPCKTR